MPIQPGGRFAPIIEGATDEQVSAQAELLRSGVLTMQIPQSSSSVSDYVTVSIGKATMTANPAFEPADLVRSAELALRSAKRSGRNRVE